MSDSDDDLLALAGIGSEGDESDYEPEIQTPKRVGGLKRKIDESEGEQDNDDDEYGEQDPYPLEGKYKDDADKAELLAMDEVTREQIIYDREQEREKYRERRFLALRARQSKAESSAIKAARTTGKSLRTSKLSELKKQRERKSRKESRAYDSDEEDVDANELADDQEASEDEDVYEENYDIDDTDTRRKKGTTSDYDDKYYQDATLKDLNAKVRASRTILSRFMFRDEFDEVIRHTYVRVNVGVSRETGQPQYRVARVEEVKRGGKPYRLLNKPCDVYLLVSQGESKKLIDMTCISDSPFSPSEFEAYRRRLDESGLELPSVGQVDAKFRELRDMSTRKLTDEDINKMVARKEAISVAAMDSGNRVKRLARLREELQVAVERQDEARVETLTKQIDELGKYVHAGHNELSRMDQINRRNKKSNETAIRRAEKLNVEHRQKQILNNNFNDPFSRLRTNPKIFYSSAQSAQKEMAGEEQPVPEHTEHREESPLKCKFIKDGIDAVIGTIDFDVQLQI
ncbi:hypothetical protein KL929_003961 [Ogataea haglerorum]|nr:hypothetical protein KL929_003961 [Ogataea haglerorum]